MASHDPLQMYSLIERTVLAQTEQCNPIATVIEFKLKLYLFEQWTLSNADWYEQFNTKVDNATSLDVVLYDSCALKHTLATDPYFLDAATGVTPALESLSADERTRLIEFMQEHHLTFLFLRNSGRPHRLRWRGWGPFAVCCLGISTAQSTGYCGSHAHILRCLIQSRICPQAIRPGWLQA